MIQVFGLIQLLSIIIVCYLEFKIKSRALFFWGTLLVMIGIPQFLEMIVSTDSLKLELMFKASLFIILFNTFYIISRILLNLNGNSGIKLKEVIDTKYEKFQSRVYLIILLSTLGLVIFISVVYFGGITQASWGKFYILNSQLNLLHPFRLNSYVFFAVSGVTFYFFLKKKWIYFILCMGVILMITLLTGNRIQLIPLIISIGLFYLINAKKGQLKRLLQISVLVIIGIYLIYLMRVVRIKGSVTNFLSSFNFEETNMFILNQLLSDDGELGLRNAFYYFIQINNNYPGFNEGASYLRMLLFWLPTSLSGGIKPSDFAITMGSAYSGNPANTTFSMHPTFYGDLFANLWWFGVVLGLLWAFIFKLLDKIANKFSAFNNILFTVILCSAYVIFARGSLYNGFFLLVVSSFFLIVIVYFTRVVYKLIIYKVKS